MKKLIIILFSLINTLAVLAQAPEKFSYQAIIRDNTKQLVKNQTIGMRLGIYRDSINGTKVYEETQTPKTNDNGLVTLQVGTGTVVAGNFSNIDWSNGPYFLKREIDLNGGTTYNITGETELLSVPYALYSKKSENHIGGDFLSSYTLSTISQTNTPVTLFTTNNNWEGNRRILLNGYITLEFVFPTLAMSNGITTGISDLDFYLVYDGQNIMPINLRYFKIGIKAPYNYQDRAKIVLPINALIPNSTPGTTKQFSIVCINNNSMTDQISILSTTYGPYMIDVIAKSVLSWIEL